MVTQTQATNWLNAQIGQPTQLKECTYPNVKSGYFICDDGRVISTLKGYCHFMTNSKANFGYNQVCMTLANGRTLSIKTHRLVAHAFIDNPLSYKHINHKDENRTNNHVSNLEWCDSYYNNHYSKSEYYKSLRGKGVGNIARFTLEDIEDMKMFKANKIKSKDIARVYNTSRGYVCNLTRGNIVRAA